MIDQNPIETDTTPAYGWAFLIIQPIFLVGLLLWLLAGAPQTAQAQSCEVFPNPQQRFGFNVARDGGRRIDNYDVSPLHGHWYLDYFTQARPSQPAEMVYAQMVRSKDWKPARITATLQTIDAVVANNPGTLWILGNEPDRDKQDHQTPAEYAIFYHDLYHVVKERDPSSRIAIAGVVQSTPLRRHYLDLVLAEYQARYETALPVDVWTMHAFILPENYVWGASIPPGMAEFADEGMQYTVDDHDSLEIFQSNILAFRQWMAANGYHDKPLLITEYGILLSDLHGFPYTKVREFMLGSFDYLLGATDADVGFPRDGNRLVQSWSWFSLNYPPYDPDTGVGHNGNLLTPEGALLALGNDYGQYIAALGATDAVKLDVPFLRLEPSVVITPDDGGTGGTIPPVRSSVGAAADGDWPPAIRLEGHLQNSGTAAGCNLQVELWHQAPAGNSTLVDHREFATLATNETVEIVFDWQPEQLTPGVHQFLLRGKVDNGDIGLPIAQQDANVSLLVLTEPLSQLLYLPAIHR